MTPTAPDPQGTATAALATTGVGEPFRPITIRRREIGRRDVLIKIAYSGICHTDVAHATCAWGPTIFPLVPGHEIAGTVSAVGPEVTRHRVGDRVGVGVMVDSCRRCPPCLTGKEQHCREHFVRTYNWRDAAGEPTHGGYSAAIVVDQDFVVGIPDRLSLQEAAPLLCAGVTVFSPLERWGAGPGTTVAVLGLGGLGHVAVRIAKAMGATVWVLDLLPDKEKDAVALGADGFVAVAEPQAFDEHRNRFDLVLSTVPARYDVDAVLRLLGVEGVLVNLGVSDQAMHVDPFLLLDNSRVVAGSSIGGIAQTQRMLDFCGAHGIGAWVEPVAAHDVDEAYRRLTAGDVRYRFVLDVSTIPPA